MSDECGARHYEYEAYVCERPAGHTGMHRAWSAFNHTVPVEERRRDNCQLEWKQQEVSASPVVYLKMMRDTRIGHTLRWLVDQGPPGTWVDHADFMRVYSDYGPKPQKDSGHWEAFRKPDVESVRYHGTDSIWWKKQMADEERPLQRREHPEKGGQKQICWLGPSLEDLPAAMSPRARQLAFEYLERLLIEKDTQELRRWVEAFRAACG